MQVITDQTSLSQFMQMGDSVRVNALRNAVKREVSTPVNNPDWVIVRDAKNLKLYRELDEKGNSVVHMSLGDDLHHVFEHKSRVTQRLENNPFELVQNKLQNGAYFFVDVGGEMKLVDFTLNSAQFIHSDDSIQHLIDLLGVTALPSSRAKHLHGTTQLKTHYLGRTYSANDLSIDLLNGDVPGGEFSSILRFIWNPFSSVINTSFELLRLICANGAVGLASFLNSRIPLVSMWQQNMDIAAKQIQLQVDNKFNKRLIQMSHTHASVGTLLNIARHAEERLTLDDIEPQKASLLEGIIRAVDPKIHCSDVYQPRVFEDANIAEQCVGHLSKMDAYNIATEISSHTQETEKSTLNAVQKIANALMWIERDFSTSRNIPTPFSSADNAFFGVLV